MTAPFPLDALPLGAALVDGGRFVAVNARFAAVACTSADHLTDAPVSDLVAPQDATLLDPGVSIDQAERAPGWHHIAGLGPDGAPWVGEVLVAAAVEGGGPRLVLLEPSPFDLVVSGRPPPPPRFAGANRLELDRLLSHDVRGGLRGVNSFLTLLARELDLDGPSSAADYLATARGAAARTDTMVERLVTLLRARRGSYRLETVAVADLVAGAARQAAEQVGCAVPVQVDPVLTAVWCDPVAGQQVLAELLTNAAKFSGGDGGAVTVELAGVRGGWMDLWVRDQGPGVDPEFCEDAFAVFRLLQPKGRFPGVGAGLALCRALMAAQGGRCWIEPSRPPGTLVGLRFAAADR
jgi:signal transduction histidine kinase